MQAQQQKEEWRQIGDWPYEASTLGRIRRKDAGGGYQAGHVLSQARSDQAAGYLRVTIRRFVHSLVAQAFLGPPPEGPEEYVVNHRDGDKSNNRPDNLEWATRSENQLHALDTGLSRGRGETHPRAKLTDEQVREIRRRYTGGWGEQTQLAKEYGVSQMLISQIVRGDIWSHLDPRYEPKKYEPKPGGPRRDGGAAHTRSKLTDDQVREILSRYADGKVSQRTLAEEYGVGRQIVRNIISRRIWKHID